MTSDETKQNRNSPHDYYPFESESQDRRKSSRALLGLGCRLNFRSGNITMPGTVQNIGQGGMKVLVDSELDAIPFYVRVTLAHGPKEEMQFEGYIDSAPVQEGTALSYRIKFFNLSAESKAALDGLAVTLNNVPDRRTRKRQISAVDINSLGFQQIQHKAKIAVPSDRRKRDRRLIAQKVDGQERRSSDRRIKDRRKVEEEIRFVNWTVNSKLKTAPEKLLQFYRKAHFLYPKKLEFILPIKDEVVDTITKLMNCDDNTCKYVFVMDGDVVKGSVMAVQYTDDTWIVQHMVVLPDCKLLAKELTLEILAWSIRNEEMRHFLSFFQNKTRWAYKTYHSLVDKVGEGRMWIEEHEYAYMRLADYKPFASGGLAATDLTDHEYNEVYSRLLETNSVISLDAIGLKNSDWRVNKAADNYARIGLSRKRQCLVVKDGGKIIGFGLADMSSYGISLSLLLNTFYVFCFDNDRKKEVYHTLVNGINKALQEQHKVYSIGFVRTEDREIFGEMGYICGRTYARYIGYRDRMRASYDFLNSGRRKDE